MRLKIVLVFLVTVLIPTGLLVYYSLQAVKGGREIWEGSMQHKYRAIAELVRAEIEISLGGLSGSARADPGVIEPLLFRNTLLFREEVMLFDGAGRAVDGTRKRGDFPTPVYLAPLGSLPYEIAVYERNPSLSGQIEKVRAHLAEQIGVVSLCALLILAGGLLTLRQVLREWKKTEAKGEFITHLSHDLKRPLTSVRMFSEMLERGRVPSDDKRKEYYRILSQESEKLIHLIHKVLDFSQIERGKKGYVLTREDLTSVVTETIQRFQTYIDGQTHRIRLEVGGPIPPLPMDPEAISHALLNLLFNATKYSPAGSEVRVVVSRNSEYASVSVIDQGIGISKKEQKKIFAEYYRVDDPEVRNREGCGLGLPLVRYAVDAHRGRVTLKSEKGKGSEFGIELPIHSA